MKKLKIVGIVMGLLVALAVGFYQLFLVPVEAQTVCDNMFKVAQEHLQETGVEITDKALENILGMSKERCVKKTDFNYRNSTQSFLDVTSHSKCVADAENWNELQQCSQ